jgi:phosphoribosylglycinamide formyltransferase-1
MSGHADSDVYRVAVLVSGTGTNLQALLDTVHGRDQIKIVCVASDKAGAPALARAETAGVETRVFRLEDFDDRPSRDTAIADWLAQSCVELVVLAGYMAILGDSFISRFQGRIINVHPSLLPAFPGLNAVAQALDYGVRIAGVTIHFVDEGVDTGPIILQAAVEVKDGDTVDDLLRRLRPLEHKLLAQAVQLAAKGALVFQ